jgi:WD40 repeat protein
VNAVAVGQLDGRTVVVSGADDRTVRVWDAATGTPVGDPTPRGDEDTTGPTAVDLAAEANAVAYGPTTHIVVDTSLGVVSIRLPEHA